MTDDPPEELKLDVNAMDMLDVTQEAWTTAQQRVRNAADVQAHYALVAILQGADPVAVAKKCGFQIEEVAEPPQDPNAVLNMLGGMGFFIGAQEQPPTGLHHFARWLAQYVERRVLGEGR